MSQYLHQECEELNDGSIRIQMVVPASSTEDLKQIIGDDLLTWADLFAYKNAGYGDMADDLGSRAQYVDLNRKCMKLKRALWDGEPLTGESVDEVVNDMIGHLFLLRVQMRKERAASASRGPRFLNTDTGVRGDPRLISSTEESEFTFEVPKRAVRDSPQA